MYHSGSRKTIVNSRPRTLIKTTSRRSNNNLKLLQSIKEPPPSTSEGKNDAAMDIIRRKSRLGSIIALNKYMKDGMKKRNDTVCIT